MEQDLLSAQEVADILKIARNTVYEIIKRGELRSSRVGKQMRVSRRDVEAYLYGRGSGAPAGDPAPRPPAPLPRELSLAPGPAFAPLAEDTVRSGEFVLCGQDLSLDLLSNQLGTAMELLQVYRSHHGSYNGIYALYQGKVNLATAHLWDGDADEYNTTYVKKMMPGIPALIMRICKRQQGLYVLKGNPKGIRTWTDFKRKDITLINREKGSGTRVLLDEHLRLMGMFGDYIDGYASECKSHLACATLVARGRADVGLGSENGCKSIPQVEFIPLQTECYDLIIRLADADKQPYRAVLEIVSSEQFRQDLDSVGGYDTSETGKIIWQ